MEEEKKRDETIPTKLDVTISVSDLVELKVLTSAIRGHADRIDAVLDTIAERGVKEDGATVKTPTYAETLQEKSEADQAAKKLEREILRRQKKDKRKK